MRQDTQPLLEFDENQTMRGEALEATRDAALRAMGIVIDQRDGINRPLKDDLYVTADEVVTCIYGRIDRKLKSTKRDRRWGSYKSLVDVAEDRIKRVLDGLAKDGTIVRYSLRAGDRPPAMGHRYGNTVVYIRPDDLKVMQARQAQANEEKRLQRERFARVADAVQAAGIPVNRSGNGTPWTIDTVEELAKRAGILE